MKFMERLFGRKTKDDVKKRGVVELSSLVPKIDFNERIVSSARDNLTGLFYSFSTDKLTELFRVTTDTTERWDDPMNERDSLKVEVETVERYFMSKNGRFLRITYHPKTNDGSVFCRDPYSGETNMFCSVIQKEDIQREYTFQNGCQEMEVVNEDLCPSAFMPEL